MDSVLCAEIDDAMKTLAGFITPEMTGGEVKTLLEIDYPIRLPGFRYAVTMHQVIAGAQVAGYCQLTPTHQIRLIRVVFFAVDDRIMSVVNVGRFVNRPGARPVGVTIV